MELFGTETESLMVLGAHTEGSRVHVMLSCHSYLQSEFLREAEIMLHFNHPNLVTLIGVAVQQRPWLCVLEYMEVSFGFGSQGWGGGFFSARDAG